MVRRSAQNETISRREFARRDGCDESLVRKAVQSRALPQLPSKRLPVALVGTAWRRGNRLRGEPGDAVAENDAPPADTLAEALRHRQIALARLRRRQYERNAALWVERETAAAGWFEIVMDVNARLSQIAPAAAALVVGKRLPEIQSVLATAINQALVDLSSRDERPGYEPARRHEPAIDDSWTRLEAERAKIDAITRSHQLALAIEAGDVVGIIPFCDAIGKHLAALRTGLLNLQAVLPPMLFQRDQAAAEQVITKAVAELVADLPSAAAILRGLQ